MHNAKIHKNKGKKFLDLLNSGEPISRRGAKVRWEMNNPSAWIKRFKDKNLIDGELVRDYKISYGLSWRKVKQVTYRVVKKKCLRNFSSSRHSHS